MKLTDLVAQIKPYVSGWLDSAIGAFSLSVQDMLAGRPTRREMEDPGVPALRVGSGDDFLDVDTDGAISLVGDAMPWDDLRVEPVARTTGSNAPTFEVYYTDGAGSRGAWLYSFDDAAAGSQKEVFFTVQLPHGWAGTAIEPHVHWLPAADGASSAVRWGLEYTWAGVGQVFGNTTILYSSTTVQGDASLIASKHYITEFAALAPTLTQRDISSILICRVFRDSANAADTYTGKCGMLYVDFHYQLDALGSDAEHTKRQALMDDAGHPLTDDAGRLLKESA